MALNSLNSQPVALVSSAGQNRHAGAEAVNATNGTRVRVTPLAVACFIAGAVDAIKLQFFGEAYGSELALPMVALLALISARNSDKGSMLPRGWTNSLGVAIFVTFAGYVISDLIVGTAFSDYIRGWGRVLILATNLICLIVIVRRDAQLFWWVMAGLGFGLLFKLRIVDHMSITNWKFGYAEPTMLFVCALAALVDKRLAAIGFALLAVYSFKFDYRSIGAMFVLLGAYALLMRNSKRRAAARTGRLRVLLALVIGAAIAWSVMQSARFGGEYWEQRRETSNLGRITALQTGIYAVSRSPIIGYGSWMRDAEVGQYQANLLAAESGYPAEKADSFNPHSMVLQAWSEGGLLGATFFLLMIACALKALWSLLDRPRDAFSYLLLAILVTGLWALINSPFGAPHRIDVAVTAVAALLAIGRDTRAAQKSLSAGRAARQRKSHAGRERLRGAQLPPTLHEPGAR